MRDSTYNHVKWKLAVQFFTVYPKIIHIAHALLCFVVIWYSSFIYILHGSSNWHYMSKMVSQITDKSTVYTTIYLR